MAWVETISPVRVYDLSLAVILILCLSSAEFDPDPTCSALNSFLKIQLILIMNFKFIIFINSYKLI